MVEKRDALALTQVPAPALVEIARRATSGEVSPRRHAASRSRVLDHAAASSRARAPWVPALLVATAAFGGVAMMMAVSVARAPARLPAVDPPGLPATHPTVPGMTASPITMSTATYLGDDENKPASMKIEVSPPQAQIFWDNERLDGNPARLTRAPDGKTHHVRAEAPGFLPKRQMVVFDARNVSISLELQPSPAEIGPIAVSGSLRNADGAIEGLRDRFRDCYAEGLAGSPGGERTRDPAGAAGSAVVLLKVSETGGVLASDIVEKTGLPPKTTTCLAYVATDAEFEPSGKPGTVRIPIAFHGAK